MQAACDLRTTIQQHPAGGSDPCEGIQPRVTPHSDRSRLADPRRERWAEPDASDKFPINDAQSSSPEAAGETCAYPGARKSSSSSDTLSRDRLRKGRSDLGGDRFAEPEQTGEEGDGVGTRDPERTCADPAGSERPMLASRRSRSERSISGPNCTPIARGSATLRNTAKAVRFRRFRTLT